MGRKYSDKLCVYMYLMAMHLYLFSVFCCAWISGGVWEWKWEEEEYSSTTCAWNRYVPCSSAVLLPSLRFVIIVVSVVIALDNLFCKFCKPLKNTFLVVCCFCHTLLQSGSNCFDNINCISITPSPSRSRSQNKLEESFVVVLLVPYSTRSA